MATKIYWRNAVTLTSWVCRACYFPRMVGGSEHKLVCFQTALCEMYNTYPVTQIPQWRNRIRGMVIRHYNEHHQEFKVY